MPATQFSFDCPYCATKGAGFVVAFQWSVRNKASQARLLALCGICDSGMIIHSHSKHSSAHLPLIQYSVDYPGESYVVLGTWPSSGVDAPDDVPVNILSFFEQGLDNLRNKRWDAAGAMFRKTLDIATKQLSPNFAKKRLFDRINAMVSKGELTPAMGEWSHRIRLDGNDAIHSDAPETEDDANSMHHFTEAFLTYAFTLPSLVVKSQTIVD